MNITADENIPHVVKAFKSLGTVTTKKGRDITSDDLQQTDILLVRSVTQVNKLLLENTPVKFVASATAGFNHVDLDYLQSQNIGFARAPGSNAISAAEYVIAGICKWSLLQKQSLADLQNLSIGIIGYGNVGSRVKHLCDEFGITAVINDPPLQEQLQQRLEQQESPDQSDITFSSLDDALACDIITLHTPLTMEGEHSTFQLINKKNIKQIKSGSLFINASRGEVVEESPLLARMKNKNDLTLILDVWENEPRINLEMLKHTLIGTPHIAGYSIDAKIRGTEMIYQAICDFLNEKPQWSSQDIDFGDDKKFDFEKTKAKDKREAILKAYDIMADDTRLRKMLSDTSLSDGGYFDSLRKNYPVRREHSGLE
ncbi:MAG TPA: 4-phosphoerythronate dehydrogenase [Leucothrix sp.]|nr:4-phosphoerythronate dehydrogenase [Leucothrix sp.]